jgi:hypothetical protein
LNFNLGELRAGFDLGISSQSGYLWSTDKDYKKMVSILAYCVNSASGLFSGFGYGIALELDLMQPVN